MSFKGTFTSAWCSKPDDPLELELSVGTDDELDVGLVEPGENITLVEGIGTATVIG